MVILIIINVVYGDDVAMTSVHANMNGVRILSIYIYQWGEEGEGRAMPSPRFVNYVSGNFCHLFVVSREMFYTLRDYVVRRRSCDQTLRGTCKKY